MRPDESINHYFCCGRCDWEDSVDVMRGMSDYECPECGAMHTVNPWEREGVFIPWEEEDEDEDDAE